MSLWELQTDLNRCELDQSRLPLSTHPFNLIISLWNSPFPLVCRSPSSLSLPPTPQRLHPHSLRPLALVILAWLDYQNFLELKSWKFCTAVSINCDVMIWYTRVDWLIKELDAKSYTGVQRVASRPTSCQTSPALSFEPLHASEKRLPKWVDN